MAGTQMEWFVEGRDKDGPYMAHERGPGGRLVAGTISAKIVGAGKAAALVWLHAALPALAAEAQANCPVGKTGDLQSSITHFVVDDELWGAFGSPLRYAIYVEVGTSKMAGRHYLENALSIIR